MQRAAIEKIDGTLEYLLVVDTRGPGKLYIKSAAGAVSSLHVHIVPPPGAPSYAET
jgi:hypothetical protein